MDQLLARAFAAYFRRGENLDQPSAADSGHAKVDGLDYIVLRNVNGVLAVYRVRNDGSLKGLRRYPVELNTW
jgi:hypothetical protein